MDSNVKYHTWSKEISVMQKGANDLDLIGLFFNALQTVYLLSYSEKKKQLFIAVYNVIKKDLSKFQPLCTAPEVIYSACVYKENEISSSWYLLGKNNVWELELMKPSLQLGKGELRKYLGLPLAEKHRERIFDGSTLVAFDQTPFIIGGKIINDNSGEIDTRARIMGGKRWAEHYYGAGSPATATGGEYEGTYVNNFLIHPRVSPLVHFYDGKFICIGGNEKSPECIFEFFQARPYYYYIAKYSTCREDPYTYTYTTERSIIAYKKYNCLIRTDDPKPASCISNNCIFIFSNQLFDKDNGLYFKFDFASGRSSGGGAGDWEFLLPEGFKPEDLFFTSAKAVCIGKDIYLVLFNKGDDHYLGEEAKMKTKTKTTKLSIFKII
ncbi:MAG: hypothetical protein V4471_05310 [Pseudomonadota bacterium]